MTCVCWREPVLSERKREGRKERKKVKETDRQRDLVEWWKRKED